MRNESHSGNDAEAKMSTIRVRVRVRVVCVIVTGGHKGVRVRARVGVRTPRICWC